MRRSIRDALVGFSIVGAISVFSGASLWIRGIQIGSKAWTINASFSDATGLAERSPVTYRGILVGSVGKIQVTPSEVKAILEINKADLRLPKPVFAKVVRGSLLGGDVQVSLVASNNPLPEETPFPNTEECLSTIILCDGDTISGDPLRSISSLAEKIEQLFDQVEQEKVLESLVSSTEQFDRTQKNLDELIIKMKSELDRAEPIISNLTNATSHISNVVENINNPKTLEDLKQTVSSTRSLTAKIDSMGGDIAELMSDEELKSALRNVTIGLGKFFQEIYPVNTYE